ncbi:clostripain-related cysteine peptidase [Thermoplasmatota archaeon]
MKKYIVLLICFFLIVATPIVFSKNDESNFNVNISNINEGWMIMYYLNGDNLLYQVQQQLVERIKNIGSTNQVHIAILHDSNENNDTKLYYLEGTNLIEQDWELESNMANPNTIRDFVRKAKEDHTFQYDVLILSSNKGSGWQGMMWDETNGDNKQITLPEFSNAFNEITDGGNDKLDVLGIETCMGGMTENAYEFKDYVDYYIAYEDCSFAGYPPYSWPFDGPLTDLISNPDMTPEEFSVNHLNYFEAKKFTMNRITTVLTVANLNQISNVKNSLDNIAQFFLENIDEYRDNIYVAIEDTRILGELWYIEFYLDPVHFLNLLSINDPEFEAFKDTCINAYDEAVVESDNLEDDPVGGLSLYIPHRKADYDHSFRFDELFSLYEETEFAGDSNWDEFIKEFLEISENTPPNKPIINGPTRGSPENEYEFIISTTDSESDEIYYYVDWNDGTTSGWLGPHQPGEEIAIQHIWSEQGTYNVRVKAKDSDESEWETLSVKMPKKIDTTSSWALLIGKISDIEKDPNQRFRFLPIKMLELSYNTEDKYSVRILDDNNGAYPCCGYIDPTEFKGLFTNSIICGLWKS